MRQSEITLREAIKNLSGFSPIKIIFNDVVLYNDYDSDIEIADGVWGEIKLPLDVIPDRLWQFDKYIVTSMNVEIVSYHHSIVKLRGRYQEEYNND